MANKLVTFDRNGRIVNTTKEGIDSDAQRINGLEVVSVPEDLLRSNENGLDPRTEFRLLMQRGNRGTGCTAGRTGGVTGCGKYEWNETVNQNVSLVQTRTRGDSTAPIYDVTTKKFGSSSVRFKGKDGGTTGGVLLLTDLPGLTLAGRGGHIGGGSGETGAGVSGGHSGDVLLQMYFYLPSTPSSDEILAMHGNSAAGGTGNSWKLYFNSSANNLKFDFNNMGDTPTGWAHSLVIAPSTSLTAGQWHHCAVIYKSRWYPSNVSEVIPYFNNARVNNGISSGVINELLRTDQPLALGAGQSGAYAFSGLIDDFHLQMGPSGGTVCNGFSGATYITAGVGGTVDDYSTLALMRFNGPSGCSRFSVDNFEKVSAKVTYWEQSQLALGVRDIKLTGNATAGFNFDYGYVEGFEGGAGHYQVSCTGGTLMSATNKLDLKKGQVRNAFLQYIGLQGISGNSGESGECKHLFGLHGSVGHGEPKFTGVDTTGFSIRLNKGTFFQVRGIVDYLNCIGGTPGTGGNFTLQDTFGNPVGFSAGHITALYQDMFIFENNLRENAIIAQDEIDNAGTGDTQSFSQISSIKLNASKIDELSIDGFNQEGTSTPPSTTTTFSTGTVAEAQKQTSFSASFSGKG